MGTVKKLAAEVEQGLKAALPKLRKTVVKKLSLVVGAMIEARTPNTAELANVLPLETERQDMREQWLRRLLSNRRLESAEVMEPFARAVLSEAAEHGQTVLLSLDQTDLGERFAVLMLSVRVGDRSLPLAWGGGSGVGEHRLCRSTGIAGTGPGVAASGGLGAAVGRAVLSLEGIV